MVQISLLIKHMQYRSIKQLFIGAIAGCISGIIWWFISKTDSSIILALVIGFASGALYPWIESKKKPYNHSLKQTGNNLGI